MKSIEDKKRDNRAGYRVPDGYFSELNHKVIDQAAAQSHSVKRMPAVRSMLSFVAGFAVMVMMAITGYYFTGHQAQNNEQEQDNFYFVSLFDVEVEEIIYAQETATDQHNALLADAAYEYLTTYGYDISDINSAE